MKKIVLCLSLIACTALSSTTEMKPGTQQAGIKNNLKLIYALEIQLKSLSALYKEKCSGSATETRAHGFYDEERNRLLGAITALCKAIETLSKAVHTQAGTIAREA